MEKHIFKRILAASLAATLTAGAALAVNAANSSKAEKGRPQASATAEYNGKAPKYVFMFIGDGMSYPQFQAAADYLAVKEDKNDDDILDGYREIYFTKFPVAGTATTFDSTSFAPDSASTATSLSTGFKTYSGVINMDETKTISYETIAEKVKDQLGYKVGIITSVNLNHATPAAYYAHQPSRSNYYDISNELIASNFEYFAGGALLQPTGKEGDKTSSYDLAEKAGYKVVKTQEEAEKLTAKDGKAIVIAEKLADSDSFSYEIDREKSEWALKDYVAKGIEVLDNDKGFFMMVEGGKIDWACHANDAGSTIKDTIAFSRSVYEAVKFYNEHPDETLIIVTGDHETGGLTIGYAGTDYDTYFENIQNQDISYSQYDSEYVKKYKENNTSFDTVMSDITKLFGLMLPTDKNADKNPNLVLNEYEIAKLKTAYEKTMDGAKGSFKRGEDDYVMYGGYEPLSVTITHILNNKSGIDFSSYSHTGLPVAVFAKGAGQDLFKGYYDNTQVYYNLAEILDVE